jgi:hypothetical protein
MEGFLVRRVPGLEDMLHPGDYVFVGKRVPIRTMEQAPVAPPKNCFQRLWWNWFGKKCALREVLELSWPEVDTVILNLTRQVTWSPWTGADF